MGAVYKGSCFCSTVQIELSGEPEDMGYCHCASCRSWSGDPVHAWTIWRAEAVRVTTGSEHVGIFHKTPDSMSHRQFCTKCGGHLMISHPTIGIVDVFAGIVPALTFAATMHVNYAESVHPMIDELPKYKDFPSELSEFGGTGELMSE